MLLAAMATFHATAAGIATACTTGMNEATVSATLTTGLITRSKALGRFFLCV